jgi:hypothetical protein
MSQNLLDDCDIIFEVGEATWATHADMTKTVKNARDAMRHAVSMSAGVALAEIKSIAAAGFRNNKLLVKLRLLLPHDLDASAWGRAAKVADFTLTLMGSTAWSNWQAYMEFPVRYAGLVSSNHANRAGAMSKMRSDWDMLMKFESRASVNMEVSEVLSAVPWTSFKVFRLVCMVFERGAWNPDYKPGQELMRALLQKLPDSRVTEEVHAFLRELQRESKDNVSTRMARMQACRASGVLEKRGFKAVDASRADFVAKYRQGRQKHNFNSQSHKLTQPWSAILKGGVRTWWSPTAKSSRVAVAAWQWCRTYMDQFLDNDRVVLSSAKASCLLPSHVLIRETPAEGESAEDCNVHCTLSASAWGAMACSTRRAPEYVPGEVFFEVVGEVNWVHCIDLQVHL